MSTLFRCSPAATCSMVGVVAELAEDRGAEDDAEPGLAGVDLSVRVPAKMVGHHFPELGDLSV